MTAYKGIAKTALNTSLAAGLLIAGLGLPAIAQSNSNSNMRQGLPGRRVSGGTRSECMANSASRIVALTPDNNLSKTTSDRPSLYFVVPTLDNDYPLAFSMRDSEGNRIYEKSFSAHENQGIMEVQLPARSLQANQNYRWYLSVVCDAQDPSQNDVLSGWLQQVEPNTALPSMPERAASAQSTEDSLAMVQSYQSAGLWNDAVALLVTLRQQHPSDSSIRDSWNQMMHTLDLDSAAETSIALR